MTQPNERPKLSLIVAMAKNRVIGTDGKIPWHLPNELQLFKRLTMGHHIIMGRKTYESINRLLPGRTTVIVTRQKDYAVPGAIVVHSLADAVDACAADPEIFVIGGADIFNLAMPMADRLYLTIVDANPVGDVLMPPVNAGEWKETGSESFAADERHAHAYRFTTYDRVHS